MSICERSYARKMAAIESERAAEENIPMTDMSQYKLMLGKLRIDLNRLKNIKSLYKKTEVKRDQLLPEYVNYIEGVLEAKSGQQDDVLLYNMVWLIDAEDYPKVFEIADYAIEHEMKMPERFKKDIPDLLVEYICNILLKKPDQLAEHIGTLKRLENLALKHDMHDAITVKLNKALGLALKEIDTEQAIICLEKVYEMDKRSGVANIIKSLKKKIAETEKTEANKTTASG